MEERYAKELAIIEKTEIEKETDIIKNIMKTSRELKTANTNFNYAQGDLVDYYVYQIKEKQSKLDYLIKLAKHKGISVDMINKTKYQLIEKNNEAI